MPDGGDTPTFAAVHSFWKIHIHSSTPGAPGVWLHVEHDVPAFTHDTSGAMQLNLDKVHHKKTSYIMGALLEPPLAPACHDI